MVTVAPPAPPSDASARSRASAGASAHAGAGRTRRWAWAIARPVAVFVPVFLLATFVTYLLRDLSGLSPAHIQLGENATPELVAQVEQEWGVDRPFWQQYADWMAGIVRGDFGRSWWNGTDIATILFDKALVSLSVAGFALLIGIVVGGLLGVLAALTATSPLDRAITGFTTAMSVMPPFVVGVALVAVFAVGLGWFPSAGYTSPAEGGIGMWLWFITLPAIALSFDTIADVARQLRTGLTSAYRENYVIGARVRGFSPQRVFGVHVLRNGVGPAVTVLGMKFPALLGGAVVTEAIFGLSGYGQFAADSALRGDVPAVQGALVISIVLVVVFNLIVNIVLGRLSPAAGRGI